MQQSTGIPQTTGIRHSTADRREHPARHSLPMGIGRGHCLRDVSPYIPIPTGPVSTETHRDWQ